MENRHAPFRITELALMGLMVACLSICSWISIPLLIPFTLQTFAVFLTAGLLGRRRATFVLLVYLLLGLASVPVFAGFKGGPAVLLGPTGGYLIGFLATAWISGFISEKWGGTRPVLVLSFVLGDAACYVFGTLWFVRIYAGTENPYSFAAALSVCVLPYLIPDALKILLATELVCRIRPALRRLSR